MNYGSVVFIGSYTTLNKITDLIDNELLLTDDVLEYEGPIDVEIDGDAILYKVDFSTNQWLDIVALRDSIIELEPMDIIHALTDGETFIEVISTNPEYDDFSDDDDDKLEDLSRMYHIDFRTNTSEDELDEEEEEDDDDDYNNWD